jgi:pseudouridine synthase
MMVKERLQKLLSRAGVGSRRACEELILEGRVKVNDTVVSSLPVMVDPESDKIFLDGRRIRISPEEKVYLMMNKPKGVLCTVKDDRGRGTIMDLFPRGSLHHRVFPVGRLDKESQGLLLLTNDGELTKKLTNPRYEIEKVYIVEIKGPVDGTVVENLHHGVWLSEGKAKASRVKIIQKGHNQSILEVTLREGRNRQIFRMFAKLGLSVKKLVRVRLGSLVLKGISVGRARRLTAGEITQLKEMVKS